MTDQEKKIVELEYQIEHYKKIIENAGLDTYDINVLTGESKESHNIAMKLGYEMHEVDTFEKRNSIFHPDDLPKSLYHAKRIMSGESNHEVFEFRLIGKNGSPIWVRNHGTSIIHPLTNELHFIGLLEDFTQEKIYLNELIYKAHHDELTSIYNRRRGFERFREVLDSLNPNQDYLTIAYLDIDNLKEINDKYGHNKGDEIIKKLPEVLLEYLKGEDILFRVGGDEFIFVAINRSIGEITEILTKVQRKYQSLFESELKTGFTFGITMVDHSSTETIDEIIHATDLHMYLNKIEKRIKDK
jgi:diguanylate cyclase (GGDEF)-like protein/PAS domain S-box-containing protein